MNVEKTRVAGVGETLSPEWVHQLGSYEIRRATKNKRETLGSYFRTALYLAQENERDNVLTYAVKRSRGFFLPDDLWSYYEAVLLRVVRKSPSALPSVSQILIEANHKGRPLDRERIWKFIVDCVVYNAPLHNELEVSWALFLSKALKIKLPTRKIRDVFKMNSSACALVALDLSSLGLMDGPISLTNWGRFLDANGLKSEMWLLAYEATLKAWVPKKAPCFVEADPLFGPMIRKGISFYDIRRNVPSTRKELRLGRREKSLLRFITAHLGEYF
jgi:hypothetical protein